MKRMTLIASVLLLAVSLLSGCASSRKAELEALQGEVSDLQDRLARLQAEKQEVETQTQELRDELRGFSEREQIQLEELNQCTILRIPNKLVFSSGSAKLSRKGNSLLDQIADILGPYPDYQIQVMGHTDNKQIKPEFQTKFFDNWALSSARASSVVRYLIDNHGKDPTKLSAVGHGEHQPVASNDTDEGRAQNRRVEFYITPGQPIKPLE